MLSISFNEKTEAVSGSSVKWVPLESDQLRKSVSSTAWEPTGTSCSSPYPLWEKVLALPPTWKSLPWVPLPLSTHENIMHSSMLIYLCLFHNVLFALSFPDFLWFCPWAPSVWTSCAALSELILSLIMTLSCCFILLCLIPTRIPAWTSSKTRPMVDSFLYPQSFLKCLLTA